MENALDYAWEQFEHGRYKEAFETAHAIGIVEDAKINLSICLFKAKCYLNFGVTLTDENSKNSFYMLVKTTASFASNIEDIWEIECDILAAMGTWSERFYKTQLSILENEPTLDYLQAYIPLEENYHIMVMAVKEILRSITTSNEYIWGSGLPVTSEYTKYLAEILHASNITKISMELETSARIYNAAMAACSSIAHESAECVNANIPSILTALLVATVLIAVYCNNTDIPTEFRYQALSIHAEILNYTLSAKVYPDGKEMSLYIGNRENYIGQLQADYTELNKLDPTFIAPTLPAVQPVIP